VAGTLRQGEQLTGTAGSWSDTGALTYAYQWYRCDPTGARCTSIHGATSATYTLVARDVGKTLGFAARATNAVGTTTAYASLVSPVAPANAATVSILQPTITGTPEPGQPLQATDGTWSSTPRRSSTSGSDAERGPIAGDGSAIAQPRTRARSSLVQQRRPQPPQHPNLVT
jgi:hypothetical protein